MSVKNVNIKRFFSGIVFGSLLFSFSSVNSDDSSTGRDLGFFSLGAAATLTVGVGGFLVGKYIVPRLREKFANEVPLNPEVQFSCKTEHDKKLSDIIGQDLVVERVSTFIELLKNYKEYKALGLKRRKGLWIEGEAENGKTLLAQAIAGELDACAIEIPNNYFLSQGSPDPFLAEFKGKLEFLINFGKEKAKTSQQLTVIFLDNLEEIAKANPGCEKIILEQIESIDDDANLLVIGVIDGSCGESDQLFRRAQVERIKILAPNKEGRIALLKHFLQTVTLAEGLSVDAVAEQWAEEMRNCMAGYLKSFVAQVAYYAGKDGCEAIESEHFEKVCADWFAGQRTNILQTKDELLKTAYHEAGHALIGILTGQRITRITIVPQTRSLGVAYYLDSHDEFVNNSKIDGEVWFRSCRNRNLRKQKK